MRNTFIIRLILLMVFMMPWAIAQDGEDTSAPDEVVTESNEDGVIVICPIKGMIEPGVMVVVERAIQEARDLNAKAIIFEVDTFGGRVDSAIDITTLIGEAPCRTISFVGGRGGTSAGAIISYACDDIIMKPDTTIGTSMVVQQTAEGMEAADEKSSSLVRAKMRALAVLNGHNPDIAEAMVDVDIELRGYTNELGEYIVYAVKTDGSEDAATKSPELKAIQEVLDTLTEDLPVDVTITPKEDENPEEESLGEDTSKTKTEIGAVIYDDGSELVLPRGELLTLIPSEAIKYGVIEATAISVDEVVTHYMLGGGTYHIIEANWAEKTFRFLTSPTIAGLLLMLAMGGLYLEVRTPGVGLPGIIGIVCLVLFFGSHYVLGLADTIDIVLVLVGICLILIEAFVIPGFGIAGVAGILCLIVGIYLSLVSFTIPQYTWEFESLSRVAHSFSVFVLSMFAFMGLMWKLMPALPFYNSMLLADTQDASAGYVGQDLDFAAASIGLRGTASTMLRPAGKGRFGDRTYDVVTRGNFIEKGTSIVIVLADGNRYVVETEEEEA